MRRLLTTLALSGALAPALAADLTGSVLSFMRAYPDPAQPYWSDPVKATTVAAGTADLIDWNSNGYHLTVDPEPQTITFSLLSTSLFVPGPQFDGFVIMGLPFLVTAVTVLSNSTGLAVTPTLAAGNALHIDLAGNNQIGSFTLGVSMVPEPAAAWLLAGGLAALALRQRRVRHRTGA